MPNNDTTIQNELKNLKQLSLPTSVKEQFVNLYFSPSRSLYRSTWFRLAFIFLCMFLGGTGIMTAAEKSQPGQLFYPVKQVVQQILPAKSTISSSPFLEQKTSPSPTFLPQKVSTVSEPTVTTNPSHTPSLVPSTTPALPTPLTSPILKVELPAVSVGIGGNVVNPHPSPQAIQPRLDLPVIPPKLIIDLPVIPPFEVDSGGTLDIGL